MLNTITDNDDGNPVLKKMAREALKEWRFFLQSVLKDGQDKKEIRGEVDPEDVLH